MSPWRWPSRSLICLKSSTSDDDQRDRVAEATRARHLSLERLRHVPAVPQPGQGIGHGLLGDPPMQPSERPRQRPGERDAEHQEQHQDRERRRPDAEEPTGLRWAEHDEGQSIPRVERRRVRPVALAARAQVGGLVRLQVLRRLGDRGGERRPSPAQHGLLARQPEDRGRVLLRRGSGEAKRADRPRVLRHPHLRVGDRVGRPTGRHHPVRVVEDLDSDDTRLPRGPVGDRAKRGPTARPQRDGEVWAARELAHFRSRIGRALVEDRDSRLEAGREAGIGLALLGILADEQQDADQRRGRHDRDQDEEKG